MATTLVAQDITPPKAKKVPFPITMQGDTWDDPYHWIHDKNDREVLNYIYAENGYTQRMMRDTELFQKKLVDELKARYAEQDQSIPQKRGDYYYYTRSKKDANYEIYCRRKGSMKGREEIILDMNELARGNAFISLSLLQLSPDQNFLAYAIDFTGDEYPTLFTKNLKTGQVYDERIEKAASIQWLNNSEEFYYSVFDTLQDAKRVLLHKVGEDPKTDLEVFKSDDLTISIGKSTSKEYILVTASSFNESYVYYSNADKSNDKFKLFQKKTLDHSYSVDHYKGDKVFHIFSNYEDDNVERIYKTPLKNTNQKNWEVLYQPKEGEAINSFDVFKDYIVLVIQQDGLENFRIINRITNESYMLEFPKTPYSIGTVTGKGFDSNVLRFSYTSFIQPEQIFDMDLSTKERTLIRQEKVYGSEGYQYNPNDYEAKRIFATARDGVKIPISIVYKKGIKLDGSNPMLLQGYGSYGITYGASFSAQDLSFLDRGMIVGRAHIRGSGYYGRDWKDAGNMMNKKNSFYDFIDAAKFLIEAGYTANDRLIAQGGSAGGMLMGGVANMDASPFHAIIANVPAVDILTILTDETLPGSKAHHQEWGDPKRNKEHYDYVKSYSPYENVQAKDYPHMLIQAGFQDIRVQYMGPTKYVARMREMATSDNLLLMNMTMAGGHGLGSGRFNSLKQSAFTMAFIFKVLGIDSDYSSVSGIVYDDNGEPLPFATVVLEGTTTGTTTNTKGEYQLELKKGKYNLLYQFVGFETQMQEVDLQKSTTLDINLKTESTLLEAVTVTSKFSDPAYGIIKHAQEKRKDYLKQVKTYQVQAYMKSVNRFDEMPKKLPPFIPKSDLPDSTDIGLIYLSESQSKISKKGKNDVKEEMISSKVAGRSQGYSWNRATDEGLNFYQNRVMLGGLNDRGFISPIAANALLFYRFEYLGELKQDGRTVNKIRVIPRRKNDPTFSGFIYIADDTWHISAIDVGLDNQHIEFFDTLTLKQEYVGVDGLDEQENYMLLSSRIYAHMSIFGFGISVNTVRSFSDYNLNPIFDKKFFNNEVFLIREEANKKDTNFWNQNRPVLLTDAEKKYYYKGDSIEVRKQSREYLDSLDRENNKFTFGSIVDGYYFYKRYNQKTYNTNGLLDAFGFNTVEGVTANLKLRMRKGDWGKWKYTWTNRLRYGISNKRLNATSALSLPLNRFKQQSLSIEGGRFIEQFNNYEPISLLINTGYSLFRRENYMKLYGKDYFQLRYKHELINGIYFDGTLKWENREPLTNTNDFAFTKETDDRFYTSNNPLDPLNNTNAFEQHQALVLDAQFRFVIKQKYARTPYGKVPERTKYPIFTLNYRKGIQAFGSDVNYDFLSLNMGHDLDFALLGTSKFDVAVGGFLNDKSVEFIDFKHFSGNQTLFLNYVPANGNLRNPLSNFQLLDYYSFSTTGNYLEAHYEHHFDGFLINKFPLLRKTKFQVVAGMNYLHQDNLDHLELTFGLENILKAFRVDFVTGYSNTDQLKGAIRLRLGL